jgi:hypothetical protein
MTDSSSLEGSGSDVERQDPPPRSPFGSTATNHPANTLPSHFDPYSYGPHEDVDFGDSVAPNPLPTTIPSCTFSSYNITSLSQYPRDAVGRTRRIRVITQIKTLLKSSGIVLIQETKLNKHAYAALRAELPKCMIYYNNHNNAS